MSEKRKLYFAALVRLRIAVFGHLNDLMMQRQPSTIIENCCQLLLTSTHCCFVPPANVVVCKECTEADGMREERSPNSSSCNITRLVGHNKLMIPWISKWRCLLTYGIPFVYQLYMKLWMELRYGNEQYALLYYNPNHFPNIPISCHVATLKLTLYPSSIIETERTWTWKYYSSNNRRT